MIENSMLKGYIIEPYSNMTNAYTCNRLVKEAKNLSMHLDIVGIHDVIARKDGLYWNDKKLDTVDFTINRVKSGKLQHEIQNLGKRNYNGQLGFDLYVNKYEQVKRLSSTNMDMPKYILATSLIGFDTAKEMLGLPFVAKGLESSQGAEVFLIESSKDMLTLNQRFGNTKEWLFEECIQTSLGRDMRFFSIRGNVIAGMVRQSTGDFRANVALGASTTTIPITKEISAIAMDIYHQTNLDFLGIDLLFGEKKPVFCEINVMPGIEGIEKTTKINVAREMLLTIKGDFTIE